MKTDTKQHVLSVTIEMVKSDGLESLSMRKVAAEAEMSLGNLQYHYKNKSALMAGVGELYFHQCEGLLDEYAQTIPKGAIEKKIKHLITYYMDHVDHLSDMCRMFRELWALATRDESIHSQLIHYYQLNFEKLSGIIEDITGQKKAAVKIAAFLIPYFEGYSITHDAMPQSKKQDIAMLVRLVMGMLE